jgi:hypothetical protein
MSWKDYMDSAMGRIGSWTVTLLGGISAWYASAPDHPLAIWVITIAVSLAVCGFIFSMGLGLEVAPVKTMVQIFVVPLLAGTLFAYLRNLNGASESLAMACAAVGVFAGVFALTGGKLLPGESAAESAAN